MLVRWWFGLHFIYLFHFGHFIVLSLADIQCFSLAIVFLPVTHES